MKQQPKKHIHTMTTHLLIWMLIAAIASPISVSAQKPPSPSGRRDTRSSYTSGHEKKVSLNFKDSPLDMVLNFYSQNLTGEKRTMIIPPSVKANITLKSQTKLSREDARIAIEAILAMHNITLVPMGEKFYKVSQIATARQDGMPIQLQIPEEDLPDIDSMLTQLIELQYLTITEAQPILKQFLHGYALIQPLERINAMLITDTSQNIQRVLEVLEFIDKPVVSRVETRVYEIKHAEAGKIASKLNEIIADVQEGKDTSSTTNPSTRRRTTSTSNRGVIRARRGRTTTPATPSTATVGESEGGEAEIIQGKVKIIADDRTNILLVISDPSNFQFFDKIITVLDRPVEPEVTVHIEPLEYADAEEIASLLNDLIGAASEDKTTAASTDASTPGDARSTALQQYVRNQAAQRAAQVDAVEKSKIGQLSENTKIIAYKETNSLLLMGRRADIAALREVIDQLDVMLAQVLIEVVILEVGLGDALEYGIDWLQRAVTVYNSENTGPDGGVGVNRPVYTFGGGTQNTGGTVQDPGSLIDRTLIPLGGALSYYATFFDLNLDAVLKLNASDRNARILQSPVIMTTDNKEATITVGEERPIVTSTTTSSSTDNQTSHYEYKNIGVELTITPHINPERFVVMEVKQAANNVQGSVRIDNNDVPIITKREMEAEIAVRSRSTIALGGLIQTDNSKQKSKVPILGDIPFIGALFRSESRSKSRTELLVLITPYVLMSPEEARAETARIKNASKAGEITWPRGWSDSPLATPGPAELKEQKRIERAKQKEEKRQQKLNERRRRMEVRRAKRMQVMENPLSESFDNPAPHHFSDQETGDNQPKIVGVPNKSSEESPWQEITTAPKTLNEPTTSDEQTIKQNKFSRIPSSASAPENESFEKEKPKAAEEKITTPVKPENDLDQILDDLMPEQ